MQSTRVATNLPLICVNLFVCLGCASSPGVDRVALSNGATEEIDPARARLTLDLILPEPAAPQPAQTPAAELSGPIARRLARAESLYAEQRYTEASIELGKALRREPDSPVLHRRIAAAYFAAGSFERSRTHLSKAIQRDADDVVTHYLLGRLAFEDGDATEAIRRYRIALKASNIDTHGAYVALAHFYLARALNAEGYLTAAIEQYRIYEHAVADMSNEDKSEPQLAILLAINGGNAGEPISVAYEKLGQFSAAADALSAALDDRTLDANARERLARLLMRSRRNDEALTQARRLLDEPNRAVALLTEIHGQTGRPEAVIDDLARMCAERPDRPEFLVAYVNVLQKFDRLEEAERVLREAKPRTTELNWKLFDILVARSQWSDALATASEALRSDSTACAEAREHVLAAAEMPGAREAWSTPVAEVSEHAAAYLLGTVALQSENVDRATVLFRRSLELNNEFEPVRVALARILVDRYDWNGVLTLTSDLPETLESSAKLPYLRGLAHAGLDQFDEADKDFNTAIRRDRANIDSMDALADMLIDRGEPRRARRQLEQILSINPLHEASRERLFELFFYDSEQDHRREAAKQLAEMRRLSASPHRIARCVARLERSDNPTSEEWDKYRRLLYDALERSGPDADTYDLIARSYLQQVKPEQARFAIQEALKLRPDDSDLLLGMVFVHNASLEYDQAIKLMDKLLARHPNRAPWLARKANMLLIDQRFDAAYTFAMQQLAKPDLSDDVTNHYRSVALTALLRSRRHDERIARIRQWREMSTEDVIWTWELLQAYRDAKRYDEAIALAREQYAREPSARGLEELRETLVQAERYTEAEQVVLTELENDPNSRRFSDAFIRTLLAAKRFDDALELVNDLRFREIVPGSVEGIRLGGIDPDQRNLFEMVILQQLGRHAEAVKLVKKWLREAEENVSSQRDVRRVEWLRNVSVNAFIQAGRFDEAVTSLNRWIEESASPNHKFEHLSRLSFCRQYQGEKAKAISALERAFALTDTLSGSSVTGVHNDLGYSYADNGINLTRAEEMIRYAVVRDPDNGAYLDSLGWVLYKRGKFEQAGAWLEKAANLLDGGDPVVHDHLGDTRWRLGQTDQAVEQWTKASNLLDEQLAVLDRPDQRMLLDAIKAKINAVSAGEPPEVATVGERKE